jgi:UDPglucose 6-dehydrogenase
MRPRSRGTLQRLLRHREIRLPHLQLRRRRPIVDLEERITGVEAVFIAVGTPPSSIDQSADLSSVFAVARDVARASSTGLVIVTVDSPGRHWRRDCRHHALDCADVAVPGRLEPRILREGMPSVLWRPTDSHWRRGRGCARCLERVYAPLTAAALLCFRPRGGSSSQPPQLLPCHQDLFINEVADLCEAVDADIDEVAAGIGLDRRISSAFLRAGPGYGGSCFPKDCDAMLATAKDTG